MPPKQRITREMILERSFTMFCQEGMGAVNARSVAKALNCSTQPIFSYFSGMDDLKNALDQKAREAFENTLKEASSEKDTLNQYTKAYVRFASEEPNLFAHMFLDVQKSATGFSMEEMLREPLWEAESKQNGLTLEQARAVCVNTLIFAHGLALIQASKNSAFALEEAEKMVMDAHEGNLLRML